MPKPKAPASPGVQMPTANQEKSETSAVATPATLEVFGWMCQVPSASPRRMTRFVPATLAASAAESPGARAPTTSLPTAGELEEWLMVVFGFREILTNFNPDDPHPERRYMVLGSVHKERIVQHAYGDTEIEAKAALVLEVAG